MAGKYYARFHVKHEDTSDSYLRKAYRNMDLHTDGTYVKDVTDWLIMTKIDEQNVEGGETAMFHLMIGSIVMIYTMIQLGNKILFGDHQKVKILITKLNTQYFHLMKKEDQQISYIDQFPEPQNMDQGNFLQRLSDGLEESKNKIITKLPVGLFCDCK